MTAHNADEIEAVANVLARFMHEYKRPRRHGHRKRGPRTHGDLLFIEAEAVLDAVSDRIAARALADAADYIRTWGLHPWYLGEFDDYTAHAVAVGGQHTDTPPVTEANDEV